MLVTDLSRFYTSFVFVAGAAVEARETTRNCHFRRLLARKSVPKQPLSSNAFLQGFRGASTKMSKKTQEWYVLHCTTDDSHVLVSDDAVIHDESVQVGDLVRFSYPGVKDLLPGTVKGMSGMSWSTGFRICCEPTHNLFRQEQCTLR